jgi:RNA polymerase sigma-70 factor (ECF subfamily)
LGVAAKAIVSVTLVSAISVGAATYVRWDAPKAAPVASVSGPRAPLTEPALRPIPTSDHVEAMHLTPATTPGEVPVASSRPAPVQAVVAPTASARTASDVTDVEAEVLLIGEAHSALQAGDSSRALILLDEHVRRFPAGALGEERDAARIVALCSLGRIAEAHTATERFLWAFPSSPHAARVRGSCGVAPAPPF